MDLQYDYVELTREVISDDDTVPKMSSENDASVQLPERAEKAA